MADPIAQDRLKQDLVRRALEILYRDSGVRSRDVNLYLKPQPIPAHGDFDLANEKRRLPTTKPSLHVFADLNPLANWGHAARHLFFSANRGELMHSESSLFPPDGFVNDPKAFEPLHLPKVFLAPVTPPYFLPQRRRERKRPRKKAGQRYAILFSGTTENRHLNDLEFCFRVLCDDYGYHPDNVYVLNHDGTLNYYGLVAPIGNWPGDNTPYKIGGRITGRGDLAAFDATFATLAGKLKAADTLFIHTNNHGGDASGLGESWLCSFPAYGLAFKASEFGARLATLPKFHSLIVSMEQCYSGGFMHPTLTNSTAALTSFASAAPADRVSSGGPDFDPWALDWLSAFHGAYPDGSPLALAVPAHPSAREAFDYSAANPHPIDDPKFLDDPVGCGGSQHLS